MVQIGNLAAFEHPAVAHIVFGWFNLAWPNVAFWAAVAVVFLIGAWARIPHGMAEDAAARGQSAGEEREA